MTGAVLMAPDVAEIAQAPSLSDFSTLSIAFSQVSLLSPQWCPTTIRLTVISSVQSDHYSDARKRQVHEGAVGQHEEGAR